MICNISNFNNPSNYRRCSNKKPWGNTIICRLLQGIWLYTHRKMEQILLSYGLPKETVTAIIILYKNIKVKVRSPDGNTDNFEIIASVLQGYKLVPYLIIICLDYVIWMFIDLMKEMALHRQRQVANNTLHKLLQMQTMWRTKCFGQIHPPRLNPCCIVLNGQLVAKASMWTLTKQNIWALIKEAKSPL